MSHSSPTVHDDDFSTATLDPKWRWVRETPTHWSLTANPGFLRIITQNKDLWQSNNTAPVLLQAAPPGDFEISTRLIMDPQQNYQQGGIVIYGDDNNYVRLTFGYFGGRGFNFGKEIGGSFASSSVAAPAGSGFYLKIARVGLTFTGSYSQDGATWAQVGQYTGVALTVAEVGLSAFTSLAVPQIAADFDFFHAQLLPCQRPPADDEFSASTLDPRWNWVRETPGYWSLTANPGSLRITTQFKDIWQGLNTAPLLFQAAPAGDFEISTRITLAPTGNYHQGGLVIYGNDNNYVRLTYGFFDTGRGVSFAKELNATATAMTTYPPSTNGLYLKISRVGQSYTAYHSQDGATWVQVGQHSNVTIAVAQVGLSAFHSNGGLPELPADSDFFHLHEPPCAVAPADSALFKPEKWPVGETSYGVQTATGNYAHVHTDVVTAGREPAPVFARAYNSADGRVGPLGPGWTHSHNVHLTGDGTGAVTLVGPRGRSDRYARNPDGTYTPPVGVDTALAKNVDGTYTATIKDQTTWHFNSGGRLLRLRDRHGNESTLSYDATGQLVSVSDPAGRGALTFGYDPTSGRLASVTDWLSPSPRVVSFQYDTSNRLWKVTDREGQVTEYGYDTSNRLATIKDARGNVRITNTYDASGLRFVLLKWAASPRKEARPRALTT